MSAYAVIRISIVDAEKLKAYQQLAPAIIEQYGGRILARGGRIVTLEGPEEKRRMVLVEFPSLENLEKFYHSDEYTRAIAVRKDAAEFEVVAIEGLN